MAGNKDSDEVVKFMLAFQQLRGKTGDDPDSIRKIAELGAPFQAPV